MVDTFSIRRCWPRRCNGRGPFRTVLVRSACTHAGLLGFSDAGRRCTNKLKTGAKRRPHAGWQSQQGAKWKGVHFSSVRRWHGCDCARRPEIPWQTGAPVAAGGDWPKSLTRCSARSNHVPARAQLTDKKLRPTVCRWRDRAGAAVLARRKTAPLIAATRSPRSRWQEPGYAFDPASLSASTTASRTRDVLRRRTRLMRDPSRRGLSRRQRQRRRKWAGSSRRSTRRRGLKFDRASLGGFILSKLGGAAANSTQNHPSLLGGDRCG